MSVQEISPIQEFKDSIFSNGKEKELFERDCPHCHSEEVKIHSHYKTKNNGERKILICQECESLFSEMYNTPIAGLVTTLSEIIRVLKNRVEGMGLNAAARTSGYSKNTILNWDEKLGALQETLFGSLVPRVISPTYRLPKLSQVRLLMTALCRSYQYPYHSHTKYRRAIIFICLSL